jgi:hypothetical protein
MTQFTKKEADQLCQEAMSDQATVYCGDHFYFGPARNKVAPTSGCKKCWMVFYLHHFKSVPPDKREAEMDELKQILMHVTESVENGTFDFRPFRRAEIKIEKDAHV